MFESYYANNETTIHSQRLTTAVSPPDVNTICPGDNTVDVLIVDEGVEDVVAVSTICLGDNTVDVLTVDEGVEVVDVNTICPGDNTVDVLIVDEGVEEVVDAVVVFMDLTL